MSYIPFWEKTKEEKQKYYEDHKASYLEKVECKDCKKFISKINLNKHLLTTTHINNFNKVKIEKVDKKTMYSCPCGGRFNEANRKYRITVRKYTNYIKLQ